MKPITTVTQETLRALHEKLRSRLVEGPKQGRNDDVVALSEAIRNVAETLR